jgi:hypothetical protein
MFSNGKNITNVAIFLFEVNGLKNINPFSNGNSSKMDLKLYIIPSININVFKWKQILLML